MLRRKLFPLASATVLLLGIDPAALLGGDLRPGDLACTSSGSVDVESTVVGPFGIEIGVKVHSEGADPNKTFAASSERGQLLSGCLSFKDENGDPVGDPQDLSIPAGGSITGPVPPGAADYEITDEPCEDGEEGDDGSGEAGGGGSGFLDLGDPRQQGGKIRRRKYAHFFQGGPLNPDPFGRNVTYYFTVYSFDRGAALEMRDAILEAGLSGSPPAIRGVDDVEVHVYLESSMNAAGDLVMTFANDDAFVTLDLTLNGDPSYASLADGTPLATSNGWEAVRFLIPNGDLIYDPTPGARWRNDFDVAFSTAGDPDDSHFSGYYEFESD